MSRSGRLFIRTAVAVAFSATLTASAPSLAQDAQGAVDDVPTWTDQAEVSFVATGGNSESSTLGLRNTLAGSLGAGTVTIEAGALRAETTTISRFAVGTAGDFVVQETSQSDLTAENYFLRGRYDRPISERLFWFAGAGWDRNEFAGIKNRNSASVGVGHTWFAVEDAHFRTDYGLTYTDQDDVVSNPAARDAFVGFRLGWDYLRSLGATTSYGNVLVLDANTDESSDYRADMTNWLAVSMSQRLALKVSLQLLFDNQPSLTVLPVFSAGGAPTEALVLAPLDDLDSILTVALVANF